MSIEAVICVAPLLPEISNQFYEDLRKIAELRPLVEDIDLSGLEEKEYIHNIYSDLDRLKKSLSIGPRVDIGREFILPL